MDNLCHSLAGAAIAQAGFARRVPRATLLCVIGANIPDVDASAYLWGDSLTALTFRRGWTHGLPALMCWTLLLAAVFWWRRPRARPGEALIHGRENTVGLTLAAAAISVFSHTSLDWLNSYGVRWLMPFSERWFYGDAIFIVDAVLLACLAGGWWFSRRRLNAGHAHPASPARLGLALALVYVATMKGISERGRRGLAETLGLPREVGARGIMVTPGPFALLTRDAVVRTDSSYDRYAVGVTRPSGAFIPYASVPRGETTSAARRVQHSPEWAQFRRWTRFPYFVDAPDGDTTTVFIGDVRYVTGTVESFASLRVRLPK